MKRKDLFKIISSALEVDSIDQNSSMENIEEWDSLGHLSILSAIDESLNGKVSDLSELASATSINKIINVLEENNLIEK